MVDERVIRMAQQHAALVVAVRRYITAEEHPDSCTCLLCGALAVVDRTPHQPIHDSGVCT